jgi:hypothetical protein
LASIGTLFADETDGFDLPESLFGDAKVGEDLTNGREGRRQNGGRLRSLIGWRGHDLWWRARSWRDAGQGLVWPARIVRQATVTELYQNPIYLAGKGIDLERKQNPRKRVSE